MPEVTACLRLASAAVWDESVCAWEGAKAAGRGGAVKAAVQLQRVWGQSEKSHHPVRGQKFNK